MSTQHDQWFRNTTASLTASLTVGDATAVTINGTPAGGLELVINVPKQSVGDTLQPILWNSTDGTTYTQLMALETLTSTATAITTTKKWRRKFHTRQKYVKLEWVLAGTSPDYGAVNAFVSIGAGQNHVGVGQNVSSNQPT